MDSQGTQIQATFFNEPAIKYEQELQEGAVYLFSGGNVKMANTKYSCIKNDYTIIFDRNCVIELAKDDARIKSQGFSFVTLEEINGFEQQRTVDMAGVILNVGPVSLFQPKDQSRPAKDKRSLTLADDTGHQIQLTLWGKNATRL